MRTDPTGRVLLGLLALCACWLVGEVVVRLTGLPLPGAVAGMLVLLAALVVRGRDDAAPTVRVGDALLTHMQLLFVPAGVGVVAYLGLLREQAAAVVVALVGAWLLCLLLVGWVASGVLHLRARGAGRPVGGAAQTGGAGGVGA